MLSRRSLSTFAVLGALAGTLLASSTATADGAHCRVQLGAGLPFVPCPHVPGAQKAPSGESSRLKAAKAQQRYYTTYGEPESITATPAPSHDIPWLTIGLAAAALAAASVAAIHHRRLRLRRRIARATT